MKSRQVTNMFCHLVKLLNGVLLNASLTQVFKNLQTALVNGTF